MNGEFFFMHSFHSPQNQKKRAEGLGLSESTKPLTIKKGGIKMEENEVVAFIDLAEATEKYLKYRLLNKPDDFNKFYQEQKEYTLNNLEFEREEDKETFMELYKLKTRQHLDIINMLIVLLLPHHIKTIKIDYELLNKKGE